MITIVVTLLSQIFTRITEVVPAWHMQNYKPVIKIVIPDLYFNLTLGDIISDEFCDQSDEYLSSLM